MYQIMVNSWSKGDFLHLIRIHIRYVHAMNYFYFNNVNVPSDVNKECVLLAKASKIWLCFVSSLCKIHVKNQRTQGHSYYHDKFSYGCHLGCNCLFQQKNKFPPLANVIITQPPYINICFFSWRTNVKSIHICSKSLQGKDWGKGTREVCVAPFVLSELSTHALCLPYVRTGQQTI